MYLMMGVISVSLIFSSSPMITVVMLLFLTLLICIMMSLSIKTSVMAYIMFLVFLGGLMIIFTYMCSLASNEKYTPSKYIMKIYFMVLILTTIFYLTTWSNMSSSEQSVKTLIKMIFLNMEVSYLYLFVYLLFTLFVTVYMTKKKEGAIRTKTAM